MQHHTHNSDQQLNGSSRCWLTQVSTQLERDMAAFFAAVACGPTGLANAKTVDIRAEGDAVKVRVLLIGVLVEVWVGVFMWRWSAGHACEGLGPGGRGQQKGDGCRASAPIT